MGAHGAVAQSGEGHDGSLAMKRARFALLYALAWAPFAAIYTLLIYVQGGATTSPLAAWIGGIWCTVFAAVLGLGVCVLVRQLVFRSMSWWVVALSHVAGAMAYAAIWTALIAASIKSNAPPEVYEIFTAAAIGWQFLSGVFLYGVIAGISHAVLINRKLAAERQAATRAEALRARAELGALRAQMNPHCLFNTLHSISALVRSDPIAAEQAIERLATLLRDVLDANRVGEDQTTLASELSFVRMQLDLERLRFGDRLRVTESIDPDALDCLVPRFTLQPLIENAIRHGIGPTARGGTISVEARLDGDELELAVRDDGVGTGSSSEPGAGGLGLRSIRQRLAAHHNGRALVSVDSGEGKGFAVRITLPAVFAEPAPVAV
jgi:two-component system LytT family sensor kinase